MIDRWLTLVVFVFSLEVVCQIPHASEPGTPLFLAQSDATENGDAAAERERRSTQEKPGNFRRSANNTSCIQAAATSFIRCHQCSRSTAKKDCDFAIRSTGKLIRVPG